MSKSPWSSHDKSSPSFPPTWRRYATEIAKGDAVLEQQISVALERVAIEAIAMTLRTLGGDKALGMLKTLVGNANAELDRRGIKHD